MGGLGREVGAALSDVPLSLLVTLLSCSPSKCHLSEGGREMFTHTTTLCLTRLAPLAGLTLPLERDDQTTPRHLVTALDVLPTSILQSLAVCGDG